MSVLSFAAKKFRTVGYSLYLWIVVRPQQVWKLMRHPEFYSSPSYFPECADTLRSRSSQFWNQMGEIMRFGRINTLYYVWGYDVKTRKEQQEYVHYNTFMYRRSELNVFRKGSTICLLRDKLLFSIFLEGLGLRGPKNVYYYDGKELLDMASKKAVGEAILLSSGDNRLFCKPLGGECGKGIFVLDIKNGQLYVGKEKITYNQLLDRLGQERFLLQDFVVQHEEMSRLHPQSINTIRLVTVRSLKDGCLHVMPSIMRIGAGDSVVDNTSQGGLAVGINLESGYLKKFGFYKPKYGTKVTEHPDSHIVFEDFKIPFFEEAVRQAKLMHSMLPDIHSIGWDIAIGEDGPIFIEGNDNWEITGPQTCNGGLKKEFEKYFF